MTSKLNEREKLLIKIQMCDFAMLEANLFLDTHKNSKDAMEYFNKHKEHSNKYREEYTQKYGPLTVREDTSTDVWEWVNSNWPWEYNGEVL